MEIIERHLKHGRHRIPGPVDLIVVHALAEQIPVTDAVVEWYATPGNYTRDGIDLSDLAGTDVYAATWLDRLGLSVHAMVAPGGELIRCREDWQGAYHARGFNDRSLGIEILVPGALEYFEFLGTIDGDPWATDAQLDTAAEWIAGRIGLDVHLSGHDEIDPGRKRDPGAGFSWRDLADRISAITNPPKRRKRRSK